MWRFMTDGQRRALLGEFGAWSTVHNRFRQRRARPLRVGPSACPATAYGQQDVINAVNPAQPQSTEKRRPGRAR